MLHPLADPAAMPERIRQLTDGLPFTTDSVGLSDSAVLLYDDMVLKISPHSPAADRAAAALRWLEGRIPVPTVLHYEVSNGRAYLLMTRIPGEMSCSTRHMQAAEATTALLADGLRMLWQIDIAACPCSSPLSKELAQARHNVANGLVDWPDGGAEGFATPESLLDWLEANQPALDPVFSHGDYCMPNVFFQDGAVSGMIDLGDAGIADRWRDIAACYGSLERNFGGVYGSPVHDDYSPALLLTCLGLTDDASLTKLHYYRLLELLY